MSASATALPKTISLSRGSTKEPRPAANAHLIVADCRLVLVPIVVEVSVVASTSGADPHRAPVALPQEIVSVPTTISAATHFVYFVATDVVQIRSGPVVVSAVSLCSQFSGDLFNIGRLTLTLGHLCSSIIQSIYVPP
jgi:hypothetical protein